MQQKDESLELRLERVKCAGNARLQLLKRFYDRRPISERYVRGGVVFHVHYLVAHGEFCAAFGVREGIHESLSFVDAFDFDASREADADLRDGEMPVFIWIGNVAKGFRPIASFVRLQQLDRCYMSGVEAAKENTASTAQILPTRESLWRLFDRKLGSFLGLPGVTLSEPIDQVIERSAQVISDLADQDAENSRHVHVRVAYLDAGAADRADLDTLVVVLAERADSNLKITKVFPCPVYPSESAVKRMRHGVFRPRGCSAVAR